MIENPEDFDCWVIPCVDARARPVFFTVAAEKGAYRWDEIKEQVLAHLKEVHGLSYIADGSGWAEDGTSKFEFWPPEEEDEPV